MPFPLPSPDELTRRQEAAMEAAVLAARPDASPEAIARAVRSPRGVLAAIVRVNAMALYEAHLHLAWWGAQLFPDSAELENLERHADVWCVRRRGATRALGRVVFTGSDGVVLPAGLTARLPAGGLVVTREAVTVTGATATVLVDAVDAGAAGNVAAGVSLPLTSPVLGLSPQAAVVDMDGLTGGADEEDTAGLLARLLEKIRRPPHGGAAFDYPVWVEERFPVARIAVIPHFAGYGSVRVVVAMGSAAAPRVPTSAELAEIQAELDARRPVTVAEMDVVGASLVPLDLTLAVSPDTAATRAAVRAAFDSYMAAEAAIGGVLRRSRMSEALSSAAGEYAHWLVAPAGDVAAGPAELPIPGAITWAST